MSTSQKVKGEGVNKVETKNYTNKYAPVIKSGDAGNTTPSVPFRGNQK